jgi:flagellar M-ring protein FliF
MNKLLENLRALGPVKLGAMAAVGAAALGFMLFLGFYGGTRPTALLYGNLGLRDAATITDTLKAQHIPYRLGDEGHAVFVASPQLDAARLLLAQHNLPSGGTAGFSLFDHASLLSSSSFLDRINETRALDGELERTIDLIQGVRAARVQVVLPNRAPFSLTTDPAQASVMLSLNGAAPLDRESINAILNLVASAVPGLNPHNISIADDRGDLLAAPGETGADQLTDRELAVKQQAQQAMDRSVTAMLAATLGPGHVHVVSTVAMNFDKSEVTSTSYDPNGQVARSTQETRQKSNRTTASDKTVSVQNDLPGANAGAAPPKRQDTESKDNQTTNYEISQTVKRVAHDAPQISRISVAVMVDGVTVPGKGKTPVWRERSAARLAAIRSLVKTAIGYDKARGDTVDVQSMPFVQEFSPAPAHPSLVAKLLSGGMLGSLLRTLIIAAAGLIALLFVFRPLMVRLITSAAPAIAASGSTPEIGASAEGGAKLDAPDEILTLGQVDGPLRAAAIRRVGDLVENNPDAALTVIRGWLGAEAAG